MKKSQQLLLLFLFISAWVAVVYQYYLNLRNQTDPVGIITIRFISYFTILTNILVGVSASYLLLNPNSKLGRFFSKPSTLTAVTVYILIVGLIYNVLLRSLWDPKGAQLIIDNMLHTINPLAFLMYWLAFVPKKDLQWKNVFPWLLYPLGYTAYILVRGAIMNEYPYPFIDVTILGYPDALKNGVGVLFTFWVLSLLMVAIAKWTSRKAR